VNTTVRHASPPGTALCRPQSLLCDPNNDSPANPEAARVSACARIRATGDSLCPYYLLPMGRDSAPFLPQLFKSDPKEYKRRVRKCAAASLEA
jgi:ubiquitin-protein ligase